jgi:cytidylate kinase
MAASAPVIAIDGPSASGKGTVAQRVARRLGYHFLDSGALYRLVALAALRKHRDLADEASLAAVARNLDAEFRGGEIYLASEQVTDAIRSEECSRAASLVAALPLVRAALLERQRAFRRHPGLVADGRDMGSTVFPDAALKVFLTASAEERARRRHNQLMDKGLCASISDLLREIRERDERDSARDVAPLRQTADARLLDTTSLSIEQAVEMVLAMYAEISAHGA